MMHLPVYMKIEDRVIDLMNNLYKDLRYADQINGCCCIQ